MQRSAQPPLLQPILTAQPALPASPRVPSPPAQRDELVAYKEAVVDLVIEAVDKLIDASGAQGSGSAAQLKDTLAPHRVQTFPQSIERHSTRSLASQWSLDTRDAGYPTDALLTPYWRPTDALLTPYTRWIKKCCSCSSSAARTSSSRTSNTTHP